MCANVAPAMRIGIYMGLINAMICLPQIMEMLSIGLVYDSVLGGDPRNALALCGLLFLVGAVLALRIDTSKDALISQQNEEQEQRI
jgi:maltose/moltooligosaccharide transporter